ncbi:hypothetical protein [Streptomyces badius]
MFGKKDGGDAGDNGERGSISSGLTMLHQAMLHTGTTLGESVDQGLAEVKQSNETGHARIAGEVASMTKALRNTQSMLPSSYPAPDTATAEEVQRLSRLVEGMQVTLADMALSVAASFPDPAAALSAAGDGQGTRPTGTVHSGGSLLNAVPEQRSDSAGTALCPPAVSAAADDAHTPAAIDDGPPEESAREAAADLHAEAAPEAEKAQEALLTRDQLTEAIREVLAQESPAPVTSEPTLEAVREVIAPLIAALPPAGAEDAVVAVAELGEQITALRAQVAGLAGRLTPPPQDEASDEPERAAPDPEHSKVLTQAAGVSSAVLVCHRDLWELLSAWAGGHPHFRMPPHISDQGENRIAADISGRSLIAVLISLAALRRTAVEGDGDGELAGAIYRRISDSLATLSPESGPLVTITLDDRSPHAPSSSDSTTSDTPPAA